MTQNPKPAGQLLAAAVVHCISHMDHIVTKIYDNETERKNHDRL
jgi:hypothetical protein